jgi:hypothetical protein
VIVATATFPRRHPDTAFRSVGEEGGLVVLPGRAEVKVLNPVGSKIFSLLDGRHTREQIAEAVAEEFDVTREQASEDLRQFLEELESNGMLEEESAE